MHISSVLPEDAPKMHDNTILSPITESHYKAILPEVYKTNVATVNSLISSILDYRLPTMTLPPDNWARFCKTYIEAQSDALVWINQVIARFDNIPQDVQSYHQDITIILADAITMAQCMIDNPERRLIYASLLNQDLTIIANKLNMVLGFVKGTIDALNDFQNALSKTAGKLHNLATIASQDAKVDQQKNTALKKSINDLNESVMGLTTSIVCLGIADAAAIAIGSLATILAFPIGGLAWLFCAPAIITASVFIDLNSKKIKAEKILIETTQREMDQRAQNVSTLHLLAQTYTGLAKSSSSAKDNLYQILENWHTLASDFSESIKDIHKVVLDVKNCNDQDIVEDLTLANDCWQKAYNDAGSLTINLDHSDAEIDIGMNEHDIKKAYQSSNVVDIVTYFN
ncbi:hypothetical protein GW590_07570 [Rahnella sp. SAP-1]|uniref:Uncharacterized protein n=1 Tax=Rouxiella aceris TaxID=2703884 RepID=A0A848MEY8_9GAMM|nr:hypothetical protein [Rouxiella aceris]NMP26717.1 hypothetical protein [Rouxiella aceris]